MNFTHTLEHHLLDHVYFRLPELLGIGLPVSKHLVMMVLASFLAMAFFIPVAVAVKSGSRNAAVSLVEAFVVFVRDDIVLSNMGEEGRKYVP